MQHRWPLRVLPALLALVVVGALVALPARAQAAQHDTVASFEDETIAYINGSVYDQAVAGRVSGTKTKWFESFADCLAAVRSGKADAACQLTPICELAALRSEGTLAMVPERVEDVDEAFFFPHGSPLVAQFNEQIAAFAADGTLEELEREWVSADDDAKSLPEQDWDAPNGTLSFATSGVIEPLSYPGPKGKAYGYDVELALLIARELGYRLKVTMVPMDSIFAEVSSGKADFGGALTVTPERAEAVDFTDSVMDIGVGLVARAEEVGGAAAAGGSGPVPEIATLDALKGKRIGLLSGAVFDQLMDAELEGPFDYLYYNSIGDMVAALKGGSIDAFVDDEPGCRLCVNRNDGIALLPEDFAEDDYGFAFPKGSALVSDVNDAIKRLRADGTLDALKEKWTGADEEAKTLPEQDWDAPNGTLVFAVDDTSEPMAYVGADGTVLGYNCDLALLIAKELGYHLDIQSMPFNSVLAAIQSDKADFGGGNISITEERKEGMDFSVPDYYGNASLVVRASAAPAGGTGTTLELSTVDEVIGKRIGIASGTTFDKLLMGAFDEVTEESFSYYNSIAEMVAALKAGKIDAAVTDLPVASLAVSKNDGIGLMPEALVEDHYGYALRKGSELTAKVNERIEAYRADGTIDKLYQKWTGSDEAAKVMPSFDEDAPNGALVVVTDGGVEPMTYLVNDEVVGMCPELMGMVAQDLGYRLEYRLTNMPSLVAELQSGKADIAMSCLSITEERQKVVDMTVPFYDGGAMAMVRLQADGAESGPSFLDGLADSFERTFVTEGRWRMVLAGLGVTLMISVASGVLGWMLGFALVLLRRKGSRAAALVIDVFEALMGGLPVVVVLMVFYYVVFGSQDIPGALVAILVFTLVFGASAGSIMWNAVKAVDIGQTEAGRALGFSDRDTFFLVVLPQAARQFLPLLRGQFVSLVKDTSVVGFIAVQDLTRAGDLIRSRTMEAFFPLIATALIYFVLCRVLAQLLDLAIRRLEPVAPAKRTIKGVEL